MSTLDAVRMTTLLGPWAEHVHGAGSTVADVAPMPGNAGLSFGFRVRQPDGADLRQVVRLAPPGVRRQGNTDVLRQVPLLRALEAEGVAVAPLQWHTDDPRWFGTDAIVQPYLDAEPFAMTREEGAASRDPAPYLDRAVDALAPLHALDWRRALPDWPSPGESPRTVVDEVTFWDRLLARAPDPEWTATGRRLAAALVADDPGDHRIGLFHGDYQTHNVLYGADGGLVAVIDWEIAGIGPVGLDLGWLSMMTDPGCWHPARVAGMAAVAEPAVLLARYEAATGRPLPHFDWYRALACYRYGAIAAFNLHLHLTRRRVDPVSELMGGGVPTLFGRGLELLA